MFDRIYAQCVLSLQAKRKATTAKVVEDEEIESDSDAYR